MGTPISGMNAVTSLANVLLEVSQAGESKKVTRQQLFQARYPNYADFVLADDAITKQSGDVFTHDGTEVSPGAASRWRTVPLAAYTEWISATLQVTFVGGGPTNGVKLKANEYFSVGSPVRAELGPGVYSYGICVAVTDTLLTVMGATWGSSFTMVSLAVGTPEMVRHVRMTFEDVTYNSSSTLVLTKGCQHLWQGATGYLCLYSCAHMNTSSTTEVHLQMNGGSNVVSTTGVLPAAGTASTYGSFTDYTGSAMISSRVRINDGELITAKTTVVGGTADYLIICMTFVVP